jgi:hypothetical protein
MYSGEGLEWGLSAKQRSYAIALRGVMRNQLDLANRAAYFTI